MRSLDLLLRDYCLRAESIYFAIVFMFFTHNKALLAQIDCFRVFSLLSSSCGIDIITGEWGRAFVGIP